MVSDLTIEEEPTELLFQKREANRAIALETLFGAMAVYTTYVVARTSLKHSLWTDLPRLSKEPWMVATLKDYYVNVLLISTWMAYRERSNWARLAWFASFCTLGSIATAGYAFLQVFNRSLGLSPERALLGRTT